MKVGTNSFTALLTDISGATVNTSAGWIVFGRVADQLLYDAAPTVTADGSGYHVINVSIPVVGRGYVGFKNGSSSVTPTFYDIEATVADVDTVNSAVARLNNDRTSTFIGNYEELDAGKFKKGDDIQFTYVVPDAIATDISGWTSFWAQLRPDSAKTTDATAYSTFYLTVDTVNKSIAFTLPSSASSLLTIDEGENSSTYWTDLQATTPAGLIKTLTEISLEITRDITHA